MFKVELEEKFPKEFLRTPSFLRKLAAAAREESEKLANFAALTERRAIEMQVRAEGHQLARELKENFDEAKLEAYVKKQRERLEAERKQTPYWG